MNLENRKYYILNIVFLIGLIGLGVNDHYFKLVFSNGVTGKLSDIVGIFILPMVFTFISPKTIKINILLTGVLFIFWKSPASQTFIDLYNQIALIQITRVVDYTDLIALLSLPVSYLFLKNLDKFEKVKIRMKGIHPLLLLIPAMFIFMATSPPRYYIYTLSNGKLKFFKCTKTVPYSKSELLNIMKKNNYDVKVDSFPTVNGSRFDTMWKKNNNELIKKLNYPYYKIDKVIIDKDTITNFQFALEKITDNKTKIWINGMNISKEIPDIKVKRKLKRYYKKLIKKHILHSIRRKDS